VQGSDIQWHGSKPNQPDWTPESRLVAFSLRNHNTGGGLYIAFNTAHKPDVLQLPHWPGRVWQIVIDTGKVR
jgi:isoamylase